MFHIVYKTVNQDNGMFYIGKHSTENINDLYLGSGVRINNAIKKYGREKFIKEILYIFETEDEALLQESKIIEELKIPNPLCYNVCPVGSGQRQKGIPLSAEHRQKITNNNGMRGKTHSDRVRKIISESKKGKPNWHKGRVRSDETRRKMSESKIGIKLSAETRAKIAAGGMGEKNHNYGKCWITKDGINMKIKKEEIDFYLELGYSKGRYFEKGSYKRVR